MTGMAVCDLLAKLLVLLSIVRQSIVVGHGYMTDPPGRNSMWRYGYQNPKNYDDNELYCGGRYNQWEKNGGRCGMCGDPYNGPRVHEAGYEGPGKGYANGIIGRHYRTGETIDVTVRLTANHKGYFKFRLCPVNNKLQKATEDCFQKYQLPSINNTKRFYVDEKESMKTVTVQLPQGLRCSQCVLQWFYATGNQGSRHETFINCADIRIDDEGSRYMTTPAPQLRRKSPLYMKDDQGNNLPGRWDCDPVPPYDEPGRMQLTYEWCLNNCILALPKDRMCASTHCDCYRLDGYNQPDWLTKMKPTSATTAAVKSHYTTTTTSLSNIEPRSKVRHTTSRPRTSQSNQSGTSTTSQSRQQDSVQDSNVSCRLQPRVSKSWSQSARVLGLGICRRRCLTPSRSTHRSCPVNLCHCTRA